MEVELEQYLDNLAHSYGVSRFYEKVDKQIYLLPLDGRHVHLIALEEGYLLTGALGSLNLDTPEAVHQFLLYANYLGQGTGNSCLGLRPDGVSVTLTMSVHHEVGYPEFREYLEEYLNYFDYWKEELPIQIAKAAQSR